VVYPFVSVRIRSTDFLNRYGLPERESATESQANVLYRGT